MTLSDLEKEAAMLFESTVVVTNELGVERGQTCGTMGVIRRWVRQPHGPTYIAETWLGFRWRVTVKRLDGTRRRLGRVRRLHDAPMQLNTPSFRF